MRTSSRRRPAAVALALALGGTLSMTATAPASAQRVENRILAELQEIRTLLDRLAADQAEMRETVEAGLRDQEEQLAAARSGRADTGAALDRLERDVSRLAARFSDMDGRLTRVITEMEEIRETGRRQALGPAGEPAPRGDGEAVDGEEGDGEEGDDGSVPADPDAGDFAAAGMEEVESDDPEGVSDATVLDEPTLAEVYLEARSDYLQGRYGLARAGYERVAEAGGELADNARYGIGECLLAEEKYEEALPHFEAIINEHPDSSKVGEAWYQKGFVFEQLGHQSDAREIYEDILDVYPGTLAARAAARRLDAMGEADRPGS